MASAIDAAWKAVEQELNEEWVLTPIAWPGANFTPPTSEPYYWLRPTMLFGDASMESMGASGTNRVVGILDLDLFDKTGNGYGVLRDYADTLRDLFGRATIGAVQFRAATAPRIINNSDGWLHLKVSVPFTIDETS